MIVVGLDVHKHSLTAVAVDELGRAVAEQTGAVCGDEVVAWARLLGDDRLWAVEDCRHVTRGLERRLLEAGESSHWKKPSCASCAGERWQALVRRRLSTTLA